MAVAVLKSLVSGREAAVVDMSRDVAAVPAAALKAPPASGDSFIKENKAQGLAGLIGGHGRQVAPQASIATPAILRRG